MIHCIAYDVLLRLFIRKHVYLLIMSSEKKRKNFSENSFFPSSLLQAFIAESTRKILIWKCGATIFGWEYKVAYLYKDYDCIYSKNKSLSFKFLVGRGK